MSKEIDEKVVSMQFDNKHFEANVKTTMSTLDKLKEKLHFSGASKGLENVSASAKKVDLSPMSRAAETVGLKFNAMYTIADQALRNITNSAMAAGKRIVSALTIDPIKTGFSEYELKMDSVKTIMASTGESIETVNKYLEELNTYSDQTIYSFSDMTQNIGKFTNAGVKLEDAVLAIKGISNEAAVSGANANEASRAMYNFAQALSAGYVKLIDWKSIELANMGTKEFKEQLIQTAVELGTVVKVGDKYQSTTTDMNGNVSELFTSTSAFNESLSAQWMTTDVLVNTLKDYADETTDIGKKAFSAAQDVTKLSQMFDVLKETAQSGWAKTWELIFGDLEQAKAIFTPLTNFFSKFIDKMNDARNAVLEGALGRTFKSLMEPLKGLKQTMETISEPIKTVTKSLDDYNKVVKEVIKGDWGITEKRWNALTEAGYDWATVQNMVNEELGCSVRHTTDFSIGQTTATKATDKATESNTAYVAMLAKKSDEELRALGLNNEQIEAIKQIRKEADKLGMSVEDFINNIDKIDGRWVVLEGFKNIGKSLGKVFKTVAQAWKEIFPPKSTEEKANALYNLLAAFHKFTKSLTMSDKTADNLKRTLKGVFAILDIITTLAGGAFKVAFKVINSVLGAFNLNILDVTALIGDAVVCVRDWIDAHNIFTKGIGVIIPYLKKAAAAIRDWVKGLKETDNIPKYIIEGLANGLTNGIKNIVNIMKDLGMKILETIKGVLGIHSPSREFFEIGSNIIQGLFNGLADGASMIWEFVKSLGQKCIDIVKDLDIGTVIAGVIGVGITYAGVKIASAIGSVASMFEGLGDMFEGVGSFMDSLGDGVESFLKGASLEMKSKAILNMAIALGILTAAIVIITKIDTGELWAAIGALAALAVIMAGLAFAASKMGEVKSIGKQSLAILALSAALLIMAKVMSTLSSLKMDDIPSILVGLGLIIGSLIGILYTFNKLNTYSESASKVGSMLLKFSIALLIMVGVIKLAGGLESGELKKGLIVIGALSLFAAGLIAVSHFAGESASKAGSMLLKFSIALLIMVGVIKLIGTLEPDEIVKGLAVIAALEVLAAGLIAVSILAGNNASKAGSMILKLSIALAIMVGVIKLIGIMDPGEIVKGLVVITVLENFMGGLIVLSALAGNNATKAGIMLLAMAGAIAILTGVIFLLSLLDESSIKKGLAAIVVMEACFAGLIAVTHLAKDSNNMKTILITMTAAIALLSVALIALSFIEPSRLAGATAALTIAMGAFALMIGITKIAKDVKAKALISLVAVVGILAALVGILSFLEAESAASAAIGLSAMLLAMAGVMAILSKTDTQIKKATKSALALSVMAVPLIAFAGVLAVLKHVDVATKNVAALIILSTAMTLLLVPLTKIGNRAVSALAGVLALTLMAVPLLAFVGILALADGLQNAMSNVIALSTLTAALSLMLIPLTLVGTFAVSALLGVVALTTMAIPLLAFVGVLALMDGLQNAMKNVLALTTLMTVMGDLLFKISIVAPLAVIGVGAMAGLTALMVAIGVLAVGLGALVDTFPALQTFIDIGIDILVQLAEGIGEMIGAFIAGFMGGVAEILPILGAQLSAFMVALTPFLTIAKTVDEQVIIGAGIIAGAVLALAVADFIAGILSLGGIGLAALGTQLSLFGAAIMPFLIQMQTVDPAAIEGVGVIASAILTLTAANIIDGIASFLGCEGGLAKFAEELPLLGDGLRGFMDNIGTFSDAEAATVTCAANAVKVLAQAAEAIPNTGGLLADLVGDNDLGTFAKEFPSLGTGLRQFLDNVGTFSDAEVATVTAASNAVKTLAQAASEIPNTGGLLADLVGDNDLESFAEGFPTLGTGIKGFLDNIGTFSDSQIATVKAAADAVKTLALVASEIPNTGGLLAAFIGDNDLADFASKFPTVGVAIKGFANAIGEFGDDKLASVQVGVDALKAITAMAKLDVDDAGDNMITIAAMIPQLFPFGEALKSFCDAVTGIDINTVNSGAAAGTRIMTMVGSFPEGGIENALAGSSSFKSRVVFFCDGIKAFATGMTGLDQTAVDRGVVASRCVWNLASSIPENALVSALNGVSSFKSRIILFCEAIKSFSTGMTDVDSSAISTAVEQVKVAMKSLGEIGDLGVLEFTNAFADAGPRVSSAVHSMLTAAVNEINSGKEKFNSLGKEIIEQFAKGISSKSETPTSKIKTIVSNALNGVKNQTTYTNFYNAGSYVVTGFTDGISGNAYKAKLKAAAMAQAALTAAKEALGIQSPSKEFYKVGDFAGLGLVNALNDYESTVYAAGTNMGNSATKGLSNAIAKVKDTIEGKIDAQPTIRPVLDLSDVNSGVGTLNGMLSISPSVGVRSSLNSINTMMNNRQNGGNRDVVSAIDGLKDVIGSASGNIYNVNGITYDDGSNIKEAVKSLVHAAKVERRI